MSLFLVVIGSGSRNSGLVFGHGSANGMWPALGQVKLSLVIITHDDIF